MAQKTDLYSILMAYANKLRSPYLEIESFLAFLENYALRFSDEHPEWKKWTTEIQIKFWSELSPLVDEKKCVLQNDNREGRIFIVDFYSQLIAQNYENPDKEAEIPYPDETSLGITIPQDLLRPLNIEYDMAIYLEDPQETTLPILKILFPDGLTPALTLSELVPRRLLQTGILKIRAYLRSHNNREYIQRRLLPQLAGKESLVKDMFSKIEMRPLDCLSNIETGGEFASLFWSYFCALLKTEIKKKNELLSLDLATLQAAYILEVFVYYFKSKAVKEREKELAFKTLELRLEKPPYAYTLDNIVKFKDNNGHDLLEQYTSDELEEFLKRKARDTADQSLPELIIFRGNDGERLFVAKSKVFPLCAKLLGDARKEARRGITKRWVKILRDYETEPAMELDGEFEKLLGKFVSALVPTLMTLLADKRLYFIQEELERTQGVLPEATRLYTKKAELIPLSSLLIIRRRDLLTDSRILLPFWYSIPIIPSILALLKRLMKRPPKRQEEEKAEDTADSNVIESANKAQGKALVAMAQQYESDVVPLGFDLDSYLEDLESRWRKLLSKESQKQLVEDVQAVARDKLRRLIRIQSNRHITAETIEMIANTVIAETPTLKELDKVESVHQYLALYSVKLLKNIKF